MWRQLRSWSGTGSVCIPYMPSRGTQVNFGAWRPAWKITEGSRAGEGIGFRPGYIGAEESNTTSLSPASGVTTRDGERRAAKRLSVLAAFS